MSNTPKPERVADQLAREVDEATVRERERRAADQHAALDRLDGLARDRLANAFGCKVADAIDLNATYCVFAVRGVGLAFSKPAADRPKDRVLIGPASPIFAVEQRLQRIAGIGV